MCEVAYYNEIPVYNKFVKENFFLKRNLYFQIVSEKFCFKFISDPELSVMIFYTDPNPAKSFGSNRIQIHNTGERYVKRHAKLRRLYVMINICFVFSD